MNEWSTLRATLTPKLLALFVWCAIFAFSSDKCYRNNLNVLDEMLLVDTDSKGYYQWLPAAVDEDISFLGMGYDIPMKNGYSLNIFMIGVALLQAPFFFLTKLLTQSTAYYGSNYFLGMAMANAFYSASAFALLLLAFTRFHKRSIVISALVIVYFGTNIVFYTARDPLTSHMFVFFLVSVMVYVASRANERGFRKQHIPWLILAIGIISLIRIPMIVLTVVPFVLWTKGTSQVQVRFNSILEGGIPTYVSLALVLLFWVIQSYYWHTISGHFFISTYAYKGEGFNWSDPHFFDVLFSHQNGFFIYAPLLLIPVGYALIKSMRGTVEMRVAAGAFLFVWLLYSFWWCWWLGGAFGHRGFIDILPLLLFPLIALIEKTSSWKLPSQLMVSIPVAFLLVMNYHLSLLYWWPWEGQDWTWATLTDNWVEAITRIVSVLHG